MSRTDWEGHFKFMILLLFFRTRLKILAFSFIHQDKSSSHMQSKTAYFFLCDTYLKFICTRNSQVVEICNVYSAFKNSFVAKYHICSLIRRVANLTAPFTVRFTILLTNGFRSSFQIPEVRHELGNFITQLSIKSGNLNQSCKFRAELRS